MEELKITKIEDKVEELDVQGQGCWNDCEIWANNTTAGKNHCERQFTAYNNPFL